MSKIKQPYAYTIRRNLRKGKYFGFLQVRTYKNNSIQGSEVICYVDPKKETLKMSNCLLWNKKGVATKIFLGETDKFACAYIICEKIEVTKLEEKNALNIEVKYSPRVLPYWNINKKNVDKNTFAILKSYGAKIFVG
jgi:hypothetical protein